jgi:hypothetical protein
VQIGVVYTNTTEHAMNGINHLLRWQVNHNPAHVCQNFTH